MTNDQAMRLIYRRYRPFHLATMVRAERRNFEIDSLELGTQAATWWRHVGFVAEAAR